MKFFVLLAVFILSTVAVKAQSEANSLAASPEDEITKIQDKGLAIIEIRIFTANLPEDLLARALEVVLNTRIQFDSCKTALEINHVIWQYKVCIITQLKIANIAITQLENEAADRVTTTTTSATVL